MSFSEVSWEINFSKLHGLIGLIKIKSDSTIVTKANYCMKDRISKGDCTKK